MTSIADAEQEFLPANEDVSVTQLTKVTCEGEEKQLSNHGSHSGQVNLEMLISFFCSKAFKISTQLRDLSFSS